MPGFRRASVRPLTYPGIFMRRALTCLFAAGAVFGSLVAAQAADIPARQAPPPAPYVTAPAFTLISEIRLGASAQEIGDGPESGSVNIVGEVLTSKFARSANPFVDLLIPAFHIGGSVNTAGDTSFAYAGFTWSYDFSPQFWIEATFGGAIHNGETGNIVPVDRNALGCSPLFRESLGIGYRFTPNWTVMAVIEHLSNAGACDENRGLTNLGARIGYRF